MKRTEERLIENAFGDNRLWVPEWTECKEARRKHPQKAKESETLKQNTEKQLIVSDI